jgi:hypothetical protein
MKKLYKPYVFVPSKPFEPGLITSGKAYRCGAPLRDERSSLFRHNVDDEVLCHRHQFAPDLGELVLEAAVLIRQLRTPGRVKQSSKLTKCGAIGILPYGLMHMVPNVDSTNPQNQK